MQRTGKRALPVMTCLMVAATLAIAVAAVVDARGDDDTTATQPAVNLEPFQKLPGVTAVVPAKPNGKPQVILFYGSASADGAPFARRLGSDESLPRLAGELNAVLLFAPPAEALASGAPDVRELQKQLRLAMAPKAAGRLPLTVVGTGNGGPAALALFARDAKLVDTLILVNPDAIDANVADSLGKASTDPRPGILLASPAHRAGAETIAAAMKVRCKKADLVEAELPDTTAFPTAHLANALHWSTPQALISDGMTSLTSSGVPASGPRRIDILTKLVELQAVAAGISADFEAPVTLAEAGTAPALAKDAALFKLLQERMKALAATAEGVKTKVTRKLEVAKKAAEKQVPRTVAQMKRASQAKREAIRSKFLAENFPWPDLLPEVAPAVTQEQFMGVIKDKCFRCHRRACDSMESLLKTKWVRPGQPDRSPVFTVLGKHKNPKATFHNVSDDQKRILHDFIEVLPKNR